MDYTSIWRRPFWLHQLSFSFFCSDILPSHEIAEIRHTNKFTTVLPPCNRIRAGVYRLKILRVIHAFNDEICEEDEGNLWLLPSILWVDLNILRFLCALAPIIFRAIDHCAFTVARRKYGAFLLERCYSIRIWLIRFDSIRIRCSEKSLWSEEIMYYLLYFETNSVSCSTCAMHGSCLLLTFFEEIVRWQVVLRLQ